MCYFALILQFECQNVFRNRFPAAIQMPLRFMMCNLPSLWGEGRERNSCSFFACNQFYLYQSIALFLSPFLSFFLSPLSRPIEVIVPPPIVSAAWLQLDLRFEIRWALPSWQVNFPWQLPRKLFLIVCLTIKEEDNGKMGHPEMALWYIRRVEQWEKEPVIE